MEENENWEYVDITVSLNVNTERQTREGLATTINTQTISMSVNPALVRGTGFMAALEGNEDLLDAIADAITVEKNGTIVRVMHEDTVLHEFVEEGSEKQEDLRGHVKTIDPDGLVTINLNSVDFAH